MEDADVFSLFESDYVTADHVINKDESIGKYAEQLSDHACHHAGTIFIRVEMGAANRCAENLFAVEGRKKLGVKTKLA